MDETTEPPPEARPAAPRRKTGLVIGAMAVLAPCLGAGAIYGIGPSPRNEESACPGAAARRATSRPWPRAMSRRSTSRHRQCPWCRSPSRRRTAASRPRRSQGPDGAAQPVGDLVRPLPHRDAGPRSPAGEPGGPRFRSRLRQYRPAQHAARRRLSSTRSRSPISPDMPIRRRESSPTSRGPASPSACRRRCSSTSRAACSPRSPARPTGRARMHGPSCRLPSVGDGALARPPVTLGTARRVCGREPPQPAGVRW